MFVILRRLLLCLLSILIHLKVVVNYLTSSGLGWRSVIDGTDGDVVNALRFAIERQHGFDSAGMGVYLEGVGCVTAEDGVGEFVVGRTDVFIDGHHRHHARPWRHRFSDVSLVDRFDENRRIVAVLDGYDDLKAENIERSVENSIIGS